LLRKWLSDHLPAAQPFAPKRGFTVPVTDWIKPRARELAKAIAQSAGVAQICVPDQVRRMFESFGDRGGKHEGIACWVLMFYALWHRIHIEQIPSGMDTVEALCG
jgi:asparagine synthase (glutamine-hydrolysing)